MKKQGGFTILELIIATSVFSLILLVVTTGLVRIGQAYYKGLIQNRTQETTRTVAEDISRSIQLAGGYKRLGTDSSQFCIGDTRYTFHLNKEVEDPFSPDGFNPDTGLIAEKIAPDASCATGPVSEKRQLLSTNMRLLRFSVERDPPTQTQTWRVIVKVAYGDDDLLTHYRNNGSAANGINADTDAAGALCKSGVSGASFCATSQLDTLVKKRLNIQ